MYKMQGHPAIAQLKGFSDPMPLPQPGPGYQAPFSINWRHFAQHPCGPERFWRGLVAENGSSAFVWVQYDIVRPSYGLVRQWMRSRIDEASCRSRSVASGGWICECLEGIPACRCEHWPGAEKREEDTSAEKNSNEEDGHDLAHGELVSLWGATINTLPWHWLASTNSSSDSVRDCHTTIFIWKEAEKWALLDCYLGSAILMTSQMLQLLCKLGRQNILHSISEKWKGVGTCRLAHGYISHRSSKNCKKFFEKVVIRHVLRGSPHIYLYTNAR